MARIFDSAGVHVISHMLDTQEKLNLIQSPYWRLDIKSDDFKLAILAETGELVNHLKYKWWKKEDSLDLDQVYLECVDIAHFLLSLILIGGQSPDKVLETFPIHTLWYSENEVKNFNKSEVYKNILIFNDHLYKAIQYDHISVLTEKFKNLLISLGLSFDNFYRMYIGKSALNLFRWENGYKEGTYIKVWDNKEDNEHLAEILKNMPIDKYDPVAYITEELLKIYPNKSESS